MKRGNKTFTRKPINYCGWMRHSGVSLYLKHPTECFNDLVGYFYVWPGLSLKNIQPGVSFWKLPADHLKISGQVFTFQNAWSRILILLESGHGIIFALYLMDLMFLCFILLRKCMRFLTCFVIRNSFFFFFDVYAVALSMASEGCHFRRTNIRLCKAVQKKQLLF